jgi:hypothetical protein
MEDLDLLLLVWERALQSNQQQVEEDFWIQDKPPSDW